MSGKIVFTFDFELGWGSIENGLWKKRESSGVYEQLRTTILHLLKLLEELEVSVTWALVAGMLDKKVFDHLDHLPTNLRDKTRSFLREARPNTVDGRDLVVLVGSSRYQRFASHGYSHVRFSYPGVSTSTINRELQLCNNVWQCFGWNIGTFVFPQNHEGFYDQLTNNGIVKARADEHGNRRRSKAKRIWDNIAMAPPLSKTTFRDGLTLEGGSLFYNSVSFTRLRLVQMQMHRGLHAAMRKDRILHVYAHPFNLAEYEPLFQSYCKMLRHVAHLRDRGLLEIATF